ncbi:PREDICTED: CD63 antigen-like isoform X2 [Habropoda laboriosa]|uniref:CD63 antigen-like isoform X2 n=1 Tax=Habropoda laboriosa TaxID=597456 RepID=UPI00083E4253|nr:PREDICTED: CD63 antigen-like isoform X2 [Habropoda laboriosa]
MNCVSDCIKWLLFVFNFLFSLCGLAILGVGVAAHLRLSSVTDHLDTGVMFPSITLIVVGSIIFVVSFFGCCGAIRESHCMTITFASFLLFILLIQVAVAVYAFMVVKNSENHGAIVESYKKMFDTYSTSQENREIIDVVQASLQCCGIDSAQDYISRNIAVPWSCCGEQQDKTCSVENSYNSGCVKSLKAALSTAGNILGGVAIGIAGVELIGIIFALCLANSIRNAQRRGYRV